MVSKKVMHDSEYEAQEEECYELETLTPIRPQFTERFKDRQGIILVDDVRTYLRKAWRK